MEECKACSGGETDQYTSFKPRYSNENKVLQSRPLVRSAFCPMKIDHTSGLTLHPCTFFGAKLAIFVKKKWKKLIILLQWTPIPASLTLCL